jgi:hypothetical protein
MASRAADAVEACGGPTSSIVYFPSSVLLILYSENGKESRGQANQEDRERSDHSIGAKRSWQRAAERASAQVFRNQSHGRGSSAASEPVFHVER